MNMQKNRKSIAFIMKSMTVSVLVFALSAVCVYAQEAKYVFLFIGDGMATVQVNAAEVYAASVIDPDTRMHEKLAMSQMPFHGLATTFSENSYITDSAAAGTALACGYKTKSGVISMNADGTVSYKSIAKAAQDAGMKVGIVSSVSIDHATPAVFYANQPSRNMYHEIDHELANSGFDYFGGGGVKRPDGPLGNVYDAATANGYTIVTDRVSLQALTPASGKVIAYNHTLDGSKALYYELDRPADHISLAEFTEKGIELLDNPNGFFMMVEGGKIDWACHANDARSAIDDTLAFDDAIKEAVEFYNDHPDETLIIVTGDHECGGMTIGYAGTAYETYFDIVNRQNQSYIEFGKVFADAIAAGDSFNDLKDDITAAFGLEFLSRAQRRMLERQAESGDHDASVTLRLAVNNWELQDLKRAFTMSMMPDSARPSDIRTYELYGYYDPLTVTCTHILNKKAGVAWTSYSHTGVPVPVFAQGVSGEDFDGFYDNTDIAKKMAASMGLSLN